MDPTWLALAVVLTVLGVLWTVYAWRARGVASAVRGAGITLLAPAAYLTGTLELLGEFAVSIGDWASGVVLSPVVWTGIGLAGGGVLLILIAGALRSRGVGTTPRPRATAPGTAPGEVDGTSRRGAIEGSRPTPAASKPPTKGTAKAAADDDLDDIEAILRRRGIE